MAIKIEMNGEHKIDVVASDIAEFIGHFSQHLSTESVFLETNLRPPRGRELQLSMRLSDGFELVNSLAMVAWQRNPHSDSPVNGGIALHLLKLEQGTEFLERLVREHEAAGGVAFSADRAAPMTEDGSPPPADALDQMMAQRGDRSATAELGSVELPVKADPSEEKGPEFAPGFGKADLWDSEVAVEIPGQVNEWLAEQKMPGQKEAETPLPPLPSVEDAGAGDGGSETGAQQPQRSSGSDPEVAASRASSPKVRSGPIKMKLAADRQPGGSSEDTAPTVDPPASSSSSFVEASRRATELISESTAPPMPSKPAEVTSEAAQADAPQLSDESILGEQAALSTVAIKPGELKKMMDRGGSDEREIPATAGMAGSTQSEGGAKAGLSDLGSSDGVEAEFADGSLNSTGPEVLRSPQESEPLAAAESATAKSATAKSATEVGKTGTGEAGSDDSVGENSAQALSLDPEILHDAGSSARAEPGFGYKDEDRSPLVIVGVIVAVIVIALILWGVVL